MNTRRLILAPLAFAFLTVLGAASASAQSLEDNEYYRKSVEFANLSQKALDEGSYVEAADYARKSQEYAALYKNYLEELLLAYRSRPALAAFYEVKLNLQRRDCLWRIAEFDFVYGDPRQWRRLYEANKESFPDPKNPDLILPGMILRIPPIQGEARSGTR